MFDWIRAAFSARASRGGVILNENWGVINTGRVKGDFVVVNGTKKAFSLHIPKVVDAVAENVGSLLTWRCRVPKTLYGRDVELAELHRWADEPAAIRVRILHGEGGAGKSRLAFEFAERLRTAGWQAGQLADPEQPVVFPLAEKGVLLVIDYPEQFSGALVALLRVLKNSELPHLRLRILLLSRNLEAMQALVNAEVESLHSSALKLNALPSEDVAWALFRDAWVTMAKLRGIPSPISLSESTFKTWIQRSASHGQPLIVLAFALNLLYEPTATELERGEILNRLAQREGDLLKREIEKHGLPVEGTLLLKALASISGPLGAAQINSLQAELHYPGISVPTTVQLQRTTLWRSSALAEVQPDLLASAFLYLVIEQWLSDMDAAGPWIWSFLTVGAPSDSEFRGRLTRMARLSIDRSQSEGHGSHDNLTVLALARLIACDEQKAARINRTLNRVELVEWPLQPISLAAAIQNANAQEALAKANFAAHAFDLAGSLNILSIRLAESHDRAGCLVAIRRAVEIYETLAKENFATYAPHLAMSFNNLSLDLANAGDRAGGLAAIRRTVAIYETLAKENFAEYAPALATSLNNLSLRLPEADDRAGGLVAIRRAVEIRESLAKENFAEYAPALAMSLNILSVRLAEAGDRANGLAAIRRAVEICETLAKENYTAYTPHLARSLYALSTQLAEDNASARQATELLGRAMEMIHPFARSGTDEAELYEAMRSRMPRAASS